MLTPPPLNASFIKLKANKALPKVTNGTLFQTVIKQTNHHKFETKR